MTSCLAFLGISHSPLYGLNSFAPDAEQALAQALQSARDAVLAFAPDRVVLVAPDHYNGFFNELMPPFCIATKATAVGDYLTPAGPLNVATDTALALAEHLMGDDFDVAISRAMQVDHGFAQPLQILFNGLDTPPVVPIFLNAVAAPTIPRLRRCRHLGESIGRFVAALPGSTLLIGSGGLSHEPPVPTLAHADAGVRDRITYKRESTPQEREAKTARVMAAGRALAAGNAAFKPLNPAWDARWMDAMQSGSIDALMGMSEEGISSEAGLSAHESKTWLVARAALPAGPLSVELRHYQAIPELIAGFGLMFGRPAGEA